MINYCIVVHQLPHGNQAFIMQNIITGQTKKRIYPIVYPLSIKLVSQQIVCFRYI